MVVTNELPPLFVSVNEAKRLLCVGHAHFYKMVKAGQIEIVKNGNKSLIPYDSILKFAASLRESRL